jgi:hypothetical protein
MEKSEQLHYSMEFLEEDGKLYVLFFDANGELAGKRELPNDFTVQGLLGRMIKN